MVSGPNRGTVQAAQVLAVPSEQHDLDLDAAVSDSAFIHRVATASSFKHQSAILLAWRRHVSLSVPPQNCRDHLANERTALGYIRTGQAFAMIGVVIAQVMRLHSTSNPDPLLGFFVVSVPLSAVCHIMALLITMLGCYRFLHWQAEMARGRAISSGWGLLIVFGLSILVLLCLFVLVVTISVRRDDQ